MHLYPHTFILLLKCYENVYSLLYSIDTSKNLSSLHYSCELMSFYRLILEACSGLLTCHDFYSATLQKC